MRASASLSSGRAGTDMAMGRQVSREILVYTFGTFVASGIQYLAVPVYTRLFAPQEFSKLVLVQTGIGLVAGIIVVGGDTALARFWFADESRDYRRRLTVTWVGFLTAFATLVTVLLLPASGLAARWAFGETGQAKLVLVGLLILVPAQTSRLLATVLRNEVRPMAFAASAIALGALTLVLGIGFAVWLDWGLTGILAGSLVAETMVLLARGWLTRHVVSGRPDRSLLRPLLLFGMPLVPVTLSFWVFTASDRLVVAKLASLKELGYYSVATTLATGFGLLIMAVGQAWTPRALQFYAADSDAARTVIGRSLTYFVFALSCIAVTASALAPWIVHVVSGTAYQSASTAVPLLMAGSVAYGSSIFTGMGVLVSNKTGWLPATTSAAAVINIALALTLVPPFGIVGAAAASTGGYLLLTGGNLWLSQRYWPVVLERRRLIVTVLGLSGATGVCTWLGTSETPLRLLVPVGFLAVVLPIAGVKASDKAFIHSTLTGAPRP
jgi:O-antigen/teichoic acid export membrane protein